MFCVVGSKPIEEFRVGDEIVSRSEFDPEGPLVTRRVLQRFVRTSPVLNLHARGRIVGTTGEHPFWVVGQGWVRASALRIGDELVSADGQKVAVEGIAPSGRTETVYNLEVEADHTYFVGGPAWHASLWAHNAGADEYGAGKKPPPVEEEAKNAANKEKEGQAAEKTLPDLSDATAKKHILEGDRNGGGHRSGTGKPGKSEFPSNWDDNKILGTLSDIVTDPKVVLSPPDARGYRTGTKSVDGVDVKVIFDQRRGRIVSGYPTNLPRNPR